MRARSGPDQNGQISHGKPRLWVVSEVYYPDLTSTGYYLTAIAEGLSEKFEVNVLCAQPNYCVRGLKASKQEINNGIRIYRAASTRLNKNVIPFRLLNMLTLGLSVFINGVRRFKRGDQVLVVTTPPNIPFIIGLASLLKSAAYTLLIHDSYPETLVAVGKMKYGSIGFRSIEFINRWLFKHARKIIVVGRDMKDLISRKTEGLDAQITVIPNWAEIDDVKPRPRESNTLIRKLGLNDKLIVLHAGNIGYPTDVETIVDCLTELSNDERFHFVFVGSGVKERVLKSAIRKRKLKNITMLGPMPRNEQIEFLNACDVGLVSLVHGMKGVAMPSKTYNIMAAGKPVLALTDSGSELAQVIDEEHIGWHLEPGNAQELKALLLRIYDMRKDLEAFGSRARLAAESKYSAERAISNFAEQLAVG